MDRFRSHIQMALMQSARERKLVAYHREDQKTGFFCVGWFDRFEGDAAVFLDVPKEVFGGEEVIVALEEISWVQTDTPYLRGLEQLWNVNDGYEEGQSGRTYTDFEYVETVLKEAWESGQVVELELNSEDGSLYAQVLDIEDEAVVLQEFFEDDASSSGIRCCKMHDIALVRQDSSRCIKIELLLGMPRRSETAAENRA